MRLLLAGASLLLNSTYPSPALTCLVLAAPVIEGSTFWAHFLLHTLMCLYSDIPILYCCIKKSPPDLTA